jgi:hypothetical protein
MDLIDPIILILGGILAASGLIVSKKPDAAKLIAKIQPYQATIGIILLVWNVWWLIHLGPGSVFSALSHTPVNAIFILAGLFSGILLGILFGMPMVAKMSASGAAKGEELGKKLAPYQLLIGLIALASGVWWLLLWIGIIKFTF